MTVHVRTERWSVVYFIRLLTVSPPGWFGIIELPTYHDFRNCEYVLWILRQIFVHADDRRMQKVVMKDIWRDFMKGFYVRVSMGVSAYV